MPRILKPALVLAILTVFSSIATADPLVFGSRALFNTAVTASPRFDEDFQGFTADTPFRIAPLNVNGNFTLQQVNLSASARTFGNLIDVPPFDFTEDSGSAYALLFTDFGSTAVDLTFTTPVYAFGAEFIDAMSGEMLDIDLFTNTNTFFATLQVTPVGVGTGVGGAGFFGFVNSSHSELIGRIRFRGRIDSGDLSGEAFGFENVVGVQPSAIPEPATMLLLGTGLAGVGAAAGARRRRRQIK